MGFKVEKDVAHITLWWFVFTMGGLFGTLAGMQFVIPFGLIITLILFTIKSYFVTQIHLDTNKEIKKFKYSKFNNSK